MPKTFDPESFDIHGFDRQTPDVYPVTKAEKINPNLLKETDQAPEPKTGGKQIFLGVIGNIFLPGLGNVILKKTNAGIALLLINLALLIATLSPTSVLGFLGNLEYPGYPPALASGLTIVPSQQGFDIELSPEMAWVFYVAIGLALVTWLHFFYLTLKKKR